MSNAASNRRLQQARLRACLLGGGATVDYRAMPRPGSLTGAPLKRSVRHTSFQLAKFK